jgi:hypothetical protein
MRGVDSYGMICGAKELGFPEEKEDSKEDKKEDKKEGKEDMNEEKVASLYDSLFPEDADLSKEASEEDNEKVAFEQNLGARSYDYMSDRWEKRISKLAADLTGSATVAAPTAEDHDGNPHKDTTPPQAQKSNKPANASDKIDTAPVYTDEIKKLDRFITMYLDYAEDQAERRMPMTMQDWKQKLDVFLQFNNKELLDNPGKVSAEIAKSFAESEFEKYRITQDRLFESDFDRLVKEQKKLEKK